VGYSVIFADEKRTKPKAPFLKLRLGDVSMSTHPIIQWRDGVVVKTHPSSVMLEANLFSPGVPVKTASGVVPYQNSACDELVGFCHYLEYPATEDALYNADVSILLEGRVRDITAILDEVAPEFRAMAEFAVDFTQTVSDPNVDNGDGNLDATGYFISVEIENETEDSQWQTTLTTS